LEFKVTLALGLILAVSFALLLSFAARKRKVPRVLLYSLASSATLVFFQLCRYGTYPVPSNSMLPTLHSGDYIGVNRFAFGLRLPWVWSKPIFGSGLPQRGDVVAFLRPERQSPIDFNDHESRAVGLTFLKRCVGLPGDVIAVRGRQLSINGALIEMKRLGVFEPIGRSATPFAADVYSESLSGTIHRTLHSQEPQLEGEWIVPEGHYFAMGDNRDGSSDSRDWGFVPESHLIGRADVVWFNTDVRRGWKGLKERIAVTISQR
jgi:signal peptidase I